MTHADRLAVADRFIQHRFAGLEAATVTYKRRHAPPELAEVFPAEPASSRILYLAGPSSEAFVGDDAIALASGWRIGLF